MSSDVEGETVELRRKRDAMDPPSPIMFIPARKQSHLPSISEIHHLRLSLNEKLMHANNGQATAANSHAQQSTKRTKPPYVTAPSSPTSMSAARKVLAVSSPPLMTNDNQSAAPTGEEYNDLHLYLIREHYKSQKSFVHSNHDNEMRRVQELREVNQQLIASSNHKASRSNAVAESGAAFFKRNSFLRNSWNVIMRQSIRLVGSGSARGSWENGKRGNGSGSEKERENGVPPRTPTNSKCSSDSEFFGNRFSFQSLRKKAGKATGSGGHKRNSSSSSFFSNR